METSRTAVTARWGLPVSRPLSTPADPLPPARGNGGALEGARALRSFWGSQACSSGEARWGQHTCAVDSELAGWALPGPPGAEGEGLGASSLPPVFFAQVGDSMGLRMHRRASRDSGCGPEPSHQWGGWTPWAALRSGAATEWACFAGASLGLSSMPEAAA